MKRFLYATTASVSAWAFFIGLDRFLFDKKIEVDILSGDNESEEKLLNRGFSRFSTIKMQREISLKSDIFSLWNNYLKIRELKPDVSQVLTPKAGLITGIASFLARTPARVYTIAGLRLETVTGFKRTILWLSEWLACLVAHKIVCVSHSLKKRVVELSLAKEDKIIVLGSGSINGIEISRYESTPARVKAARQIREQFNIPLDAPVLGFVGRLTRDKGIRELVDSFQNVLEKFPNTYLVILGDYEVGDPVLENNRNQIESNPQIVKLGFVADPSSYYQVLDMLILPTYREGFPNVPLEAAAAGKPVITTNATGAVDSVIDSVTGLIVPVGDIKALTRAICTLLENPEMAIAMGQAGKNRAEKDFKPEEIWQGLHQLYTSLYTERIGIQQQRARWLKRCFDIIAVSGALVLLAPVLVIVAWLVRQRLGTPILFSQKRPGLNGKPFEMYKFRTMTDARDGSGNLLPDADRLTPFGKWLRATSLDELPGLWNVLRGDMSLVGPRPLLMEYLERYTSEQARRHEVKPGITGWAQVNGRNSISWEEKFKLDVWYVNNQTLILDIQILWKTVIKVIKRDGISAIGDATMPVFTGQIEPNQ